MPEVRPNATAHRSGAAHRPASGFELRLDRGGAHVHLAPSPPGTGLAVEALDLEIPDVRPPIDVGAGPSQFQSRLCDLCKLAVRLEPALLTAAASRLDRAALGLDALEVALQDGFIEVGGTLRGGPAFALRIALVQAVERGVQAVPYAARLFGPSAVPAAALAAQAARALRELGVPDDPLPALLRKLLVARGWKAPRDKAVRLSALSVTPAGIKLAWDRQPSGPISPPIDPDLLAALEGGRAFEAAEQLVADGDWAGARDALLTDPAAPSHPFAAERLLSLLCLEERFHDEALDLAADWLARRPGFAPALAAEAWIRLARGEHERAAGSLVALAEEAVSRNERIAAAAAAEATLALPGVSRAIRQRAVDAALAVRRDHLPAIRALRTLAKEIGDKGGQLRAVRRLLAYAPGDAEKARAHAELGELLLEKDPPAARLHLDRALRLDPGDPESMATLARACLAAGEHLRAVRALDRLRELKVEAGETAEAARLALQAGAIWEAPLGHLENAWLRYREATELGPDAAEAHRLAASCAARLGRWADAADHHAAALAMLDAGTPAGAAAAAGHHLALAEVAELHLDDPAGAAGHLEAASALGPPDPSRLSRLASLYRRLDRPAELAAVLERLAPLGADPVERAAMLAEAGDLLRQKLGRDEAAQARYAAALGHEPACRRALSGMAAVASARGDAAAERDALQRLLAISSDKGEQASLLDRLASACERSGDLPAAARAVASARRLAPTRARLAAAVALARTAGDRASLSGLLDELARAASADGDPAGAAAAFRERCDLLEPDDLPLAMASLAEARRLLPGDTALLRRQAALAARAGDHQLALGALRALLEGEPVDAPALELAAARTALTAGQLTEACAHAQRAFVAGATGAVEVLDEALTRSGDESGRAGLLSRLGRHLEAAALHEQLGDVSAAVGALEAAASQPATAPEALRHLIRLRAQRGDAPGTAAALVAAARLAGGREGAELALRAFHLAPSDEALDVAAAADPAFAPARGERARRRAESDPQGALSDAEAALAGEQLDPVRRPELLKLSARLALSAGDTELGRRRLAAFCQVGVPDDADLARLADLQRAAGDREGLVTALEKRLPLAPPELALPLRLELAGLLAGVGRDQDAVTRWRQALSLDRQALPALRALLDPSRAGVLVDGERPALLTLLARHAEAPPADRAAAWDELAALREKARDLRGAMEAVAEAARLRGQDDDTLELQAALATRLGDHGAAATALLARARRGVERTEAGAPARLVEAGLAALAAGQEAEGVAALEQAIGLAPGAEALRAARTALLERAARLGDLAGEAAQLATLVPLLPTGERPAQLLRLADLRAALHDRAGAHAAAEEARQLAPRDLQTVHRTRLAAEAAGTAERVTELLAEEAQLDEALAGPLLLDRARRLLALGHAEAADDAFSEAQLQLGADLAVATEQSRLRRTQPLGRPASEPLERCARRLADPGAAARVFLAAGALALQEDDRGRALRCARRAYSRRRDAPAEAGPLLARLLYEQGAFAEALVLHRALLESDFAGLEDADVVVLCRQLAELAAEAGEQAVAVRALDRLLALRPQEAEAARLRYAVEPDRVRAVSTLAEIAARQGSEATRSALLGQAAEGALAELRNRDLGERLFREARAQGARVGGAVLGLVRRRVEVTRAADLGPEALLSALQEAAEATADAGQTAEARAYLEEAVREERSRGMRSAAARDLAQLEALLATEGDFRAAAEKARQAGELLAEAGELPAALEALTRAAEGEPEHRPTLERISELSRALGPAGARSLASALARLAGLAPSGAARAAALVRLADAEERALSDAARAEASLLAALAEVPGDGAAESALQGLLARTGRTGDLARRLLDQARQQQDRAGRTAVRRRAVELLAGSAEVPDLDLAADAAVAVALDWPGDLAAARAAAAALRAAGRRDEAVPHLALVARLEPDDEPAAAALLEAYADRPRERAELHLARAAAARDATRAARLRAASRAYFDAGEQLRADWAMEQAFLAWPADEAAFAGAVAAAGADMDRLDAVLASRAAAVPEEAAGCHRARADMLFTMGQLERAAEAFEAALAADPEDAAGLATLGACLASLHGPEAARYTDRRLAALAELRPGRVPASLEAEARYRLGLHADPAAPAASVRTDLERAIWLAPEDPRADRAFEALAEAHVRLDDLPGALAAVRARAERAAARGDQASQLAALERGVALASGLSEPSQDGAALLDGLLERRIAGASPAEEVEALARLVAATWRTLDQEPRARLALTRAGLPPVEPPPHLVAVEEIEDEPVAVEPVAVEPVAVEPVAVEPVAVEPVAVEPVAAEPVAVEPAAVEPVAVEPVAVEPVAVEPVAVEPVAVEPVAVEPVAVEPAAVEPAAVEPVAVEPVAVEPVAVEPVAVEPVAVEPAVAELVVESPEAVAAPDELSTAAAPEPAVPAFALEPSPTGLDLVAPDEGWEGLYSDFQPAPHELFASPEDADDLTSQLPFQGPPPSDADAEEASELAAAFGGEEQPAEAAAEEPSTLAAPAAPPAAPLAELAPAESFQPAAPVEETAPETTALAEPGPGSTGTAEAVEITAPVDEAPAGSAAEALPAEPSASASLEPAAAPGETFPAPTPVEAAAPEAAPLEAAPTPEPMVEAAPEAVAFAEPALAATAFAESPMEPAAVVAAEAVAAPLPEAIAETSTETFAEPVTAAAVEPLQPPEPEVEVAPEEAAFAEPALEEPAFDEAPETVELVVASAVAPPAETLAAEPHAFLTPELAGAAGPAETFAGPAPAEAAPLPEPVVEPEPEESAYAEPTLEEPAFAEALVEPTAEAPVELAAPAVAEPQAETHAEPVPETFAEPVAAAAVEPLQAPEPELEGPTEESAYAEPTLEEPAFAEAPGIAEPGFAAAFEPAAEPPVAEPTPAPIPEAFPAPSIPEAFAEPAPSIPEPATLRPEESPLDAGPGAFEPAAHAEPAFAPEAHLEASPLAEPALPAEPEALAEPATLAEPVFAEPARLETPPAAPLPSVILLDAGPGASEPAAHAEPAVEPETHLEPSLHAEPEAPAEPAIAEPAALEAPALEAPPAEAGPSEAPVAEEPFAPFAPFAPEPAPREDSFAELADTPAAEAPLPFELPEVPSAEELASSPLLLDAELPVEPLPAAEPPVELNSADLLLAEVVPAESPPDFAGTLGLAEPAAAPEEMPAPVSEELGFSLEDRPAPVEAVEAVETEDEAARREAEGHARVAEATLDPRDRALAWLACADALARAGASPEEVRRTIDRACEADADALEPWTALAAHLDEYGRPLEAARAHLAVSIRSEGSRAATASLTAARLFHLAGRHEDSARAFRVTNAAQPHCVPPALILAEQALARGDLDSASENLVLIDEQALPEAIRSTFRHALALASGAAHAEPPPASEPVAELPPEPVPTSEELAAATSTAWPVEPPPPVAPAAPQAAAADPVASILREQADLADGPDRASLLERLAGHYQRSGRGGEAADAMMEALLTDPARAEGWERLSELVEEAPDRAARAAVLRARLLPPSAIRPPPVPLPEPAPEAAPAAADPWATPMAEEAEPLDLGLASAEDLARQLVETTDEIVLEPTPPPMPLLPTDRATQILTLVREHAAAGNRRALASISDEAEALLGVAVLRPFATSLGRAALDSGRAEVAYRWLMLAREDDPEELTIARDLSRAAERTGRHAEEVAFGEPCADAIAPHDPLAAAARYHHLAHVLADKVGDLAGAAGILSKALALVPDDRTGRRQLWSLWGRLEETQPSALDAWLEAARAEPSDVEALGQAADLAALLARREPPAQAARLDERARLVTSLAAFVAHGRAAPEARLARTLPQSALDAVTAPGADGPLALLLGMLAPYLEPLFPADLARRGATAADRLAPPKGPVVRQALERAAALLEARAHVPFLVDRPGAELALENTRPPALIVPAGVEALPEPVVLFLAVRALDLLGRGWALAGKFAPRDVGILLELACRFAGATPPSMGLPAERATAFLEALARSVPPTVADRVRPLGGAAAEELSRVDVRALTAAIRATGGRVALLATGDPNAALTALQLLDRQREARSGGGPYPAAEQRELAELALSDPFLLLRTSIID